MPQDRGPLEKDGGAGVAEAQAAKGMAEVKTQARPARTAKHIKAVLPSANPVEPADNPTTRATPHNTSHRLEATRLDLHLRRRLEATRLDLHLRSFRELVEEWDRHPLFSVRQDSRK